MKRLRVGVVVQRYGLDVCGGAEELCRLISERLSQYCECDVITTCARDYVMWRNEYKPGQSFLNGVRVRRFAVDCPRNMTTFGRLSEAVFTSNGHDMAQQEEWMKNQGPYSSLLLRYLRDHYNHYDAFIFFTYLYCTTYYGLPIVRDRSILVSTAHGEMPIYLSIFDHLFQQPKRLIFLTEEEQDFVLRRFCLPADHCDIAGLGLPQAPESPGAIPIAIQERLRDAPYILYLGRIDESKGCQELLTWFIQFIERNPDNPLHLVLAGRAAMDVPSHSRVIMAGYLSESDKHICIRNAQFMIAPSPHESLCIAALEAWTHKKPLLVNGRCSVLAGQCHRSAGGLWYRNYEEFTECVTVLHSDDSLRAQLGESGQRYVERVYRWDQVESVYLKSIEAVASAQANLAGESVSVEAVISEHAG